MTFYGTHGRPARAGSCPRSTWSRWATTASRSIPIGLGPYKFVSHTPGVELVMEANEGYWRKMPSVKRLVFKSVPESTTRMAMLKRGEVDVAYLLDVPQAAGGQARSQPQARVLGRHRHLLPRLPRPVGSRSRRGPTGACGWPRAYAHRPEGAERGGDAGRVAAGRQLRAARLRVRAAASSRIPTIRRGPSSSSPRRAIRTASTPASFHQLPPVLLAGRGDRQLLAGGGHPDEDAADGARRVLRRAPGRRSSRASACAAARSTATPPRGCRRSIPSDGAFAYGGYPDIDALYKQQAARRTGRSARRCSTRSSASCTSACASRRSTSTSGRAAIGPRVAEPALMMIDPYPWSAPLEEVRLKKN